MPRRAYGVLVLADRLEDPAPRAAHECPGHQAHQRDERPADHHHPEVVGRPAHQGADLHRLVERVVGAERLGERLEAVLAAEVLQEADRAHHLSHDLGGRDRHDREVVGAQPQRGHTEQERQQRGHEEAGGDAEPEAQAPRGHERGHRVATDRHEGGLAEVEQSGVAELDVEADRREAVDHGGRADGLLQGVTQQSHEIHVVLPPTRSALADRGCLADGPAAPGSARPAHRRT